MPSLIPVEAGEKLMARMAEERMPVPVPAARLRPPRHRAGLVARPALVDRLVGAALDKRLVLLSAASGFGKTTLMADAWRALLAKGVPVLWLTVVEGDHDPSWLARTLVEQLARLFDATAATGEDFGSLATRLVQDETVVVMIDNWNFIENEAANRLFDRLLAETEGLASFVVSSRTIPGFLFETLRLSGTFAGFGARDLAFSTEEASAVLAPAGGLSLPVFDLIERTEGWPAGVQLLRLALEGAGGQVGPMFDFSGSRSDVAAYLGKAFFRHLPPVRRAFLCNIAVLDELSPEIVVHVLDDPAAAAAFEALERDNLFLADAADGSGRFRFHSLFRDFLLSQHAREATLNQATVLGRASEWHCRHDELGSAIRYCSRVGRDAEAMALLERYGATRLSSDGRLYQYANWVAELVRRGAATTPVIDHWFCWALVFSGRWREAMTFRAESGGIDDPEIRAIVAAFSDDQPAAREAMEQWRTEGERGDPLTLAVMRCAAAVAQMAAGNIDAALAATRQAGFAIERTEAAFGHVWVPVMSGFAHLMKGRADIAEAQVRDGIRVAERMLGPTVPVTRIARQMAAVVAWHRCADDQAVADLRAAGQSAQEHGLPLIVAGAASVARALRLPWQDRRVEDELVSPAITLLRAAWRAEALLQRLPVIDEAREIVRLLDSDLEAARARTPDLLADGWLLRETMVGIRARLHLLLGEGERAEHLLTPAILDCQRRGNGLSELTLGLLKVAALYRQDKRSAALRLLIQLAEQAVAGGLLRPFLSERRLIEPLLSALAEAGARAPIGDPEGWRRLARALSLDQRPEERRFDAHAPDPLTEREREMLSFLDIGLSNQEIGERLAISVPTVKWHLHNLFSKIGVRNRGGAVRFAREHNLLRR